MMANSRTPEELETLLEDTLLLGDLNAVSELFEDWALIAMADGSQEVRGGKHIASLAAKRWDEGDRYMAEPRLVLQARDIALVLGPRGTNVVRRAPDGVWRYAILHLLTDQECEGERNEHAINKTDA